MMYFWTSCIYGVERLFGLGSTLRKIKLYVSLGEHCWSFYDLDIGVPQGPVFSRLFFLIYIMLHFQWIFFFSIDKMFLRLFFSMYMYMPYRSLDLIHYFDDTTRFLTNKIWLSCSIVSLMICNIFTVGYRLTNWNQLIHGNLASNCINVLSDM